MLFWPISSSCVSLKQRQQDRRLSRLEPSLRRCERCSYWVHGYAEDIVKRFRDPVTSSAFDYF